MTSRSGWPGRTREPARPAARPRLMFVVTSHVTAAGFLVGLAGHLARSGWEVSVVCSPGPDGELPTIPDARVVGVRMHREPRPGSDARSVRLLWATMRELAPDVVVTATPKAGLLGTVAARMRRVPVVVHLMWGLRSETLHGASRVLVRALEGVATRWSHAVVPNSASLAAELIRAGLADPGRVTVIGAGSSHGVDVDRFRPGRGDAPVPGGIAEGLDRLGGDPVVGFVGRLTADKGVATLLEAARLLGLRGHGVRLLLVGAAEDPALVAQVRAARDGGLPILLVEGVDDTAPLYPLMDVHCLPTLREGFPNVCLEAAASAVPTVTTDATGAVDSVLPGCTGLIVPHSDAPALADALATLLDDGDLRDRLGRAGRAWVEREFAADLVERRHADYLRDLCRARTGTRDTPVGAGTGAEGSR